MENAAGTLGLEEMVKDMSVGALAYDTGPAIERRQAGYVLAGVSVACDRQGRDDPAHAALGRRRSEIRPDDAQLCRAVRG